MAVFMKLSITRLYRAASRAALVVRRALAPVGESMSGAARAPLEASSRSTPAEQHG